MGLNCKIVYRDGQALALNDNGQISPLYLEALELYKDEKRALNIWAVSQSEDFQDAFGITPEEAILTDVVTYLDTKSFVDKRMSSSDKIQVKAFMVKNGIESLSDLNSTLSSIFKSKGYFQFDEQKMVDSGLWKASELPYAKTQRKEIQALLSRIEGELITSDITVVAEDNTNQYRDSANKTIFGTSEIIDATEISRAINKLITNFQDSEEFYAKIKELPFEEFVEKFYTNDKFAEELINRYKQIKKVPVLSFVNGELSADNNETYTTLKNTLLSNINSVSVEADLSYLLSISPEIWNTSQRAIKDILKEVEQEVAKINVDVVGLRNYSNQQENIIDLLSSLNRMVQSPTETNIQEFAQKKDNLIAPEDNTFITETLPENLMNLNIVRLDSTRTDNELFVEHGLIKIGDNIYHKVRRGQITELYDYLYNQVVDEEIDIPTKTQDKTDKPAILKEIAEFVNARNTGIVSEFQEEISLNQLAFGHPINTQGEISQLPIITTNTDYLKTEFISDFYNYILEEKLKNSELYRDVLSHFTINDRDISLQGTKTPNIEGIKYEIELRDYSRLKRDNSLKAFVESFSMGVSQDLYALNFPEKLPTYRGEIVTDGDFAILNKTNLDIVKFNNKVYRKVGENFKVSVYQEIKTKPDTVYYTTNLNFTSDREAVEKVMERYPEGLSVQTLTYEQKQENLKKARMTESVPHAKYQIISEGNTLTGNDKVFFESAKEMETKGKSREEIFKETRWFKVKGNQWRREIGDLKLKTPDADLLQDLLEEGEALIDLNDLFNTSEVDSNYNSNNLKLYIRHNESKKESIKGEAIKAETDTIIIDIFSERSSDAIMRILRGGVAGTGSKTSVPRTIETVVSHELAHQISFEAGRKVGNSPQQILNFYVRRHALEFKENANSSDIINKLTEIYQVDNFLNDVVMPIYENSIGEKEAMMVEERLLDKTTVPSAFEEALDVDVTDFINGTPSANSLGLDYMDASPTDLKFNQNLIEFIRQKGVQVITDPEQMQAELEGAMPMIVGERGARELDQLEDATNRIDNLVIARKMEVSGKSPLEIKRATLWERGSDKKWRFETLDGELKINEIQHDQEYTISDLFEESDMTKLYGDIKVIFTNEGYNNNITARAIDNDGTMSITFNTHTIPSQNTYTKRTTTDIRNNWRNARGMVRDTLIHEGQHAVQKEAGFELGGNSFTAIKRAIEIIDGTPQDVESQLRIKAENYLRNNDRQQYGRLVEGLLEYLSTPKEFRQVVLDKLYERLSGETEARNAEERANMTLEEKRNKLLSETQDVATEDQLFLADAITPSEFYKYYNINAMVSEDIKEVRDKEGNLLAPNGKKSKLNEVQWKLVRSEEFKNWFGDWETNPENASKVIDENGEPLVVYHGTQSKPFTEFKVSEEGIHFGTEEQAESFFPKVVYPVFLNVRNITDGLDQEELLKKEIDKILEREGITYITDILLTEAIKNNSTYKEQLNENSDGIRYLNIVEGNKSSPSYAVFNSNQIKSATGENTTFDIQSNDINYLQTPAGNVLGFEKNGIIYLDETQLNNVTTIHELVHVKQMVIDIKAAQGDEIAQKIITKREELFNDEAEAVMQFHYNNNINSISVYHGGTVETLLDASKNNPLFVSEDISQAQEYLKEREGKISTFSINPSKIADEDITYSVINELELQSKEEGWDINDLNIFELLDSNFSTSLSKEDTNKVFSALENKGYGAIRFTDTNLKTLKQDISNIVIFNSYLTTSSAENINPMIIGEKGAKEMIEINQLLDAAKKMDADGIHPTQIEKTTGWFKEFDQWRYFSKEALETFNIQNEAYNKLDVEQNLEDVIGTDNILFTFYPQLKQTKVVFYEGREDILGSEQGERIMVNTRRSTDTINGGEYLGGLAGAGRGITREESIILTLAHETSHRIQTLEGTLRGGSTETIIREAQRITGEQRPQLGFLRDSIEKTIESTENNEELFILENALIVVNSRLVEDESNALKVYKSLYGEAEARSLEYAKSELTKGRDLSDVTFTELREKLLEAENLTAEGLIPIRGEGENKSQLKDIIGLDLSSPLYAQRPNESRQEWKTRLLKEVEAYVVAPAIAEKLENLRKENPSLWQQITDYINMLTNWLKDQIGLTDYKGDIMDMTKEEYVNALGVSILKDEYTVLPTYQQLQDKYNSIAPFKNGEIEIIYHHTEAQHEEIMNKIDECGS